MNWDAIGAIGEILGAGGVLITLIYLASCGASIGCSHSSPAE